MNGLLTLTRMPFCKVRLEVFKLDSVQFRIKSWQCPQIGQQHGIKNKVGSYAYSLVPRLEAGLSGTYTANTHPLSLGRFNVESSLIGLMKQNTKIL